jgi:hypothetical protein
MFGSDGASKSVGKAAISSKLRFNRKQISVKTFRSMGLPEKNFQMGWRVSKPTSAAKYSCVHPVRRKACLAFLMPSGDA